MKIFVIDNNSKNNCPTLPVSWYFLADSSLTNSGKPFFLPDFANKFEAIPVVAVKINRLGKSISPKFANRYYSEYAGGIHFRAKDLLEELRGSQLPADKACSFDRSLIMGEFLPLAIGQPCDMTMTKNGETVAFFSLQPLLHTMGKILQEVSGANTLKMGDLIIPALPEGTEIKIGDILQLHAGDVTLLTVQIK